MTNTAKFGVWLSMIIATGVILFSFLTVPIAQAQSTDSTTPVGEACNALTELGEAGCEEDNEAALVGVAKTAINILSLIIGVAAVIVIIVAGFRFIISGGDSQAVASSRNTIIYAIVGLVIVVFAQVIVVFVLNKLS